MGNCFCCIKKEFKINSHGDKYIEIFSYNGKYVDQVFNILKRTYINHRITSIPYSEDDVLSKLNKNTIIIYYDKINQNVVKVILFE